MLDDRFEEIVLVEDAAVERGSDDVNVLEIEFGVTAGTRVVVTEAEVV